MSAPTPDDNATSSPLNCLMYRDQEHLVEKVLALRQERRAREQANLDLVAKLQAVMAGPVFTDLSDTCTAYCDKQSAIRGDAERLYEALLDAKQQNAPNAADLYNGVENAPSADEVADAQRLAAELRLQHTQIYQEIMVGGSANPATTATLTGGKRPAPDSNALFAFKAPTTAPANRLKRPNKLPRFGGVNPFGPPPSRAAGVGTSANAFATAPKFTFGYSGTSDASSRNVDGALAQLPPITMVPSTDQSPPGRSFMDDDDPQERIRLFEIAMQSRDPASLELLEDELPRPRVIPRFTFETPELDHLRAARASTSAAANNENNEPSDEVPEGSTELVVGNKGEEDEETVHSVRAKLFRYDDTEKSYAQLGIGELRLNRKRDDKSVYRLLCRVGVSGTPRLNARVYAGMPMAVIGDAKKDIQTMLPIDDKMTRVLIRVKNGVMANELHMKLMEAIAASTT